MANAAARLKAPIVFLDFRVPSCYAFPLKARTFS